MKRTDNRIKVREAIIVEGRYDKNAVSQIFDALVIETSGFHIFNDPQQRKFISAVAQRSGLLILTDSDSAGFMIRNCIKGFVDERYIKNAFIPEIKGKERRKAHAGREGIIGVEGMGREVLVEALRKAGAEMTFPDSSVSAAEQEQNERTGAAAGISSADLFSLGFSGREDSRARRQELLKRLNLPSRMSTPSLLGVLNVMFSREEFLDFCREVEE